MVRGEGLIHRGKKVSEQAERVSEWQSKREHEAGPSVCFSVRSAAYW